MISGARGEAMWSSLGMKFVSPDRGIRLFDQMMRHEMDQVAVVDADWLTFVGKIGMPRFLSELVNTAVEPRELDARCVRVGRVPKGERQVTRAAVEDACNNRSRMSSVSSMISIQICHSTKLGSTH